MTDKTPVPSDVFVYCESLLLHSAAHYARPEQGAAKQAVARALANNDLAGLVEPLRELGRAFLKDINGKVIPDSVAITRRHAYALANECEYRLWEASRNWRAA